MNLFIFITLLALFVHCHAVSKEVNPSRSLQLQSLIDKMRVKKPELVDRLTGENKPNDQLMAELEKMQELYDYPDHWPIELEKEDEEYEHVKIDPKIVKLDDKIEDLLRWQMKLWWKFFSFENIMEAKVKRLAEDVIKSNFGILSNLAKKEFEEKVKAPDHPYAYQDYTSGGLVLDKFWEFQILNAQNEPTENTIVFSFKEGKFVRNSPHGKKVISPNVSHEAFQNVDVQSIVNGFTARTRISPRAGDKKSGGNLDGAVSVPLQSPPISPSKWKHISVAVHQQHPFLHAPLVAPVQ